MTGIKLWIVGLCIAPFVPLLAAVLAANAWHWMGFGFVGARLRRHSH